MKKEAQNDENYFNNRIFFIKEKTIASTIRTFMGRYQMTYFITVFNKDISS
jgi:hypothetical protein